MIRKTKTAPVAIDPLQSAVDQSAGAVSLFTAVVVELAEANEALDDIAIAAQQEIEAQQARLRTAVEQRKANLAVAAKIRDLVA